MGEDDRLGHILMNVKISGISFISLVMESLGGWNVKGLEVINYIGKIQGLVYAEVSSPQLLRKIFFQSLLATLWCGNANLWTAQNPHVPSSVDGVI